MWSRRHPGVCRGRRSRFDASRHGRPADHIHWGPIPLFSLHRYYAAKKQEVINMCIVRQTTLGSKSARTLTSLGTKSKTNQLCSPRFALLGIVQPGLHVDCTDLTGLWEWGRGGGVFRYNSFFQCSRTHLHAIHSIMWTKAG